jgi:Protein of unknown function C-terminus (DUF2399)
MKVAGKPGSIRVAASSRATARTVPGAQLPVVVPDYHGDFDWAGLAIARSLSVAGALPWRLRQLRRELREYAGEKHEQIWLAETAQHIPLVNAMAPQNHREVDELLRSGMTVEPTDLEYARAVQRGLARRAPFTGEKNSTAEALIIETYASQIAHADTEDVYAFVTSNHKDFSVPSGDHRLPHPDVADLFDGARSRYIYQVEGLHELLVDQFGDEYLEEYHEVEFLIDGDEEPRTLAEIIEAAQSTSTASGTCAASPWRTTARYRMTSGRA